jgi:hypothetical protein
MKHLITYVQKEGKREMKGKIKKVKLTLKLEPLKMAFIRHSLLATVEIKFGK